jgi:dihydrolipoamide dehydrogenase
VHGAREAAASADVDVAAALAWRDYMVSDYSGAGQERWLAEHGIALLRGDGKLAGTGVVDVDGVQHTADHVVVATGADPIVPPVPGLRELDGVWGTREATSMKEVPRRLLVLGGGSAGVELAQVVRRFGGEAMIVEASDRVLPREAESLGHALGEALRRDGIEVAAVVPAVDEGADATGEVGDAGEAAAMDGLAFDDPEPHLDQVEPRGGGRGEVHLHPRVRGQPVADLHALWAA